MIYYGRWRAIDKSILQFCHEEMKSLAGAKKVASFALRFRSGTYTEPAIGLDDDAFTEALRTCASLGVLPSVPACGNPAVLNKLAEELVSAGSIAPEASLLASPEHFEADVISRVALLASDSACPVLFSRIQSPVALKALTKQRRNGVVLRETSIAAIGSVYVGNTVTHSNWAKAASFVADPPIRPEMKVARQLLKHVATGELLAVGSAHRAIATSIRAGLGMEDYRRIPVGQATASGRLSALWKCGVSKEALLDACAFVATTSTNPARLFNLYPKKGRIAEGSDADLVIWNPESQAEPLKSIPNDVEDPFAGLLEAPSCRQLVRCIHDWE